MPLPDGDLRETVYNGIRFATQLNAAWARYFNEIEARWRYEESGDPADFLLPDFLGQNLYVDVRAQCEQRYDKPLIRSLLEAESASLAVVYGWPNMARVDVFHWHGTVERNVEARRFFYPRLVNPGQKGGIDDGG